MRRFRGKHISAGCDFDARRAPETAGFRVVRQSKHIVMSNGQRILTVPRYNTVYAITRDGIVCDTGLTVEQFRELP